MKIDGCTQRPPFIFCLFGSKVLKGSGQNSGKISVKTRVDQLWVTTALRWRLEYSRWPFSGGTSIFIYTFAWFKTCRCWLVLPPKCFCQKCHVIWLGCLWPPLLCYRDRKLPGHLQMNGICWGDSKGKDRVWWQDPRLFDFCKDSSIFSSEDSAFAIL